MDAEDDRQPVPFKVLKAAIEAAELRADLEGIGDRMEIIVGMRLRPEEDSEVKPEGGVASLSADPDAKKHMQLLMEVTQAFAKQTDYPLEMMVIAKEPQGG